MGIFLPPSWKHHSHQYCYTGEVKATASISCTFPLGLLWLFLPLLSSFLNRLCYYWGLHYTLLNERQPHGNHSFQSMGHCGICFAWSSGNKAQSAGSILTRKVGRDFTMPHGAGWGHLGHFSDCQSHGAQKNGLGCFTSCCLPQRLYPLSFLKPTICWKRIRLLRRVGLLAGRQYKGLSSTYLSPIFFPPHKIFYLRFFHHSSNPMTD